MNTTNLLKIALRALANNKLRGFLTMLGIIIGVASVITMLAIGQGSKRSIQAQISEMGSNMIMIQPGADMRGGVRQDASAMETLKLQDYEDIVNETRYVSATSPSVNSSGQAIYGANNAPNTDLPYLYSGAFAFLYTSLRESFGIPLLEAMACGTPVVTSNTSSMPEVGGPGALLCDPTDAKDIAHKILSLEKDPALYRQQIQYGLRRAKRFSWETTATELLSIYKSI